VKRARTQYALNAGTILWAWATVNRSFTGQNAPLVSRRGRRPAVPALRRCAPLGFAPLRSLLPALVWAAPPPVEGGPPSCAAGQADAN
jgi:hypothetical protein